MNLKILFGVLLVGLFLSGYFYLSQFKVIGDASRFSGEEGTYGTPYVCVDNAKNVFFLSQLPPKETILKYKIKCWKYK